MKQVARNQGVSDGGAGTAAALLLATLVIAELLVRVLTMAAANHRELEILRAQLRASYEIRTRASEQAEGEIKATEEERLRFIARLEKLLDSIRGDADSSHEPGTPTPHPLRTQDSSQEF